MGGGRWRGGEGKRGRGRGRRMGEKERKRGGKEGGRGERGERGRRRGKRRLTEIIQYGATKLSAAACREKLRRNRVLSSTRPNFPSTFTSFVCLQPCSSCQ